MEEILVLMHQDWWDKAYTPLMENVYISFVISANFACLYAIQKLRNLNVDKLRIENTDSVCEIWIFYYLLKFKTTRYR